MAFLIALHFLSNSFRMHQGVMPIKKTWELKLRLNCSQFNYLGLFWWKIQSKQNCFEWQLVISKTSVEELLMQYIMMHKTGSWQHSGWHFFILCILVNGEMWMRVCVYVCALLKVCSLALCVVFICPGTDRVWQCKRVGTGSLFKRSSLLQSRVNSRSWQ